MEWLLSYSVLDRTLSSVTRWVTCLQMGSPPHCCGIGPVFAAANADRRQAGPPVPFRAGWQQDRIAVPLVRLVRAGHFGLSVARIAPQLAGHLDVLHADLFMFAQPVRVLLPAPGFGLVFVRQVMPGKRSLWLIARKSARVS